MEKAKLLSMFLFGLLLTLVFIACGDVSTAPAKSNISSKQALEADGWNYGNCVQLRARVENNNNTIMVANDSNQDMAINFSYMHNDKEEDHTIDDLHSSQSHGFLTKGYHNFRISQIMSGSGGVHCYIDLTL